MGYAANIPDQLVGVTVPLPVALAAGGLGLYVDAKLDNASPEDEEGFLPDLTAEQVEDTRNDGVFDATGAGRR